MDYGDDNLAYNQTAVANTKFDISLTGQAMNDQEVQGAFGPRLKLIVKGQDCRYASNINTISGVQCDAPPQGSPSASVAAYCQTPPSLFTSYLHRWTDIKINACGTFDVCHCNRGCTETDNWHHIGSIAVSPNVEVGGVSKPLPGCEAAVPTFPMNTSGRTERSVQKLTDITLAIFGGLEKEDEGPILEACKNTLAFTLSAYSTLMNRDAPHAAEIAGGRVLDPNEDRRLRGASLRDSRRLQNICLDNDLLFKQEATAANLPFDTCEEMLANFGGDTSVFCVEPTIQTLVENGCQRTCALCPDMSTTTTTEGPTMAPEVQASLMTFNFRVSTYTTFSAENVLGRLELMKIDTVPFAQRLQVDLEITFEAANIPLSRIPTQIWVNMTAGPVQIGVIQETPKVEEEELSGTSLIFIMFGLALAGSCIFGLLLVLCWYLYARRQRKFNKVEPTPVEKVTKISDGGYRVKTFQVGGETPEEEPYEPDCCERVCTRCYRLFRRCCPKKKLKKVEAWSEDSTPGETADPSKLKPGTKVRLFGLTSAHYNGLPGTIRSGPNEKGRFEVDLLVVNNDAAEEQQTLSFKADNMKILALVDSDSEASPKAAPLKPGEGGSYLSR
jgi:hypothetical protein